MIRAILYLLNEAKWALVERYFSRDPAPREEGWWLEGEQGRDEATRQYWRDVDAKAREEILRKLRRDMGKP